MRFQKELFVIISVLVFTALSVNVFGIAVEDYDIAVINPVETETEYEMDWSYVYNLRSSSSVAVSEYWLLTADHVSSDKLSENNLSIGESTYNAVELVDHSASDDPDHDSKADLSLIRYDKAFPGHYGLSPDLSEDLETLLVGFGYEGTVDDINNNPTQPYDYYSNDDTGRNTRRWGTNRISSFETRNNNEGYDQYFVVDDTDYEAGVLPGDSGGGTFVNNNGTWELAGINIYALDGGDVDGDGETEYVGGFSASVPAYNRWITTVIPEPTTGLTLIILSLCALLSRPRRRAAA